MNTTIELETQQTKEVARKIVMDVQDITKTLPLGREQIEILKGISFQILSGEFVSLVGPSGSGRSTLLGIIAGLDNPTTGQVLIDGVGITRMTESRLAAVRNSKIGMVFQAFNLIPTLTAQENVEIPLYVGMHKGSPSTRARELLALVDLTHRLNHRPNQLSGGEQHPRLKTLLEEHSDGKSLIDISLSELKSFTGEGWDQEDDVTMVALERNP